jgi:uncharacterized membrane protein
VAGGRNWAKFLEELRSAAFRIRSMPIQFALLLSSIVIYSVIYSILTVLRFLSFNAGVADLGLAGDSLYYVFRGGLIPTSSNPSPILMNKLIYIPISMVYYFFPSEELLLIFQTVWIALAAIPLYLISIKVNRSRNLALAFGLLWLIYYPIAGVNWFDFHFMALFPTFFLSGFYFYLAGRRKLSFTFFILSATTDYLVVLTVIFFALYLYLKDIRERKNPFRNYFAHSVLIASILIFAAIYFYFGAGYTSSVAHVTATNISAPTLSTKLYYIFYMMLPLLFLPLLGLDLMFLAIPFLSFIYFNSYTPYVQTEYYQYPSLIAPILFVAAIKGYSRIKVPGIRIDYKKVKKALVIVIVLFNVFLVSFLTPAGQLVTGNTINSQYGLLFSGNTGSYNMPSSIEMHQYDYYLRNDIIPLIPHRVPVLIQNNMPELAQNYYNWYMPGYFPNGTVPVYIITDPYSASYATPPFYTVPRGDNNWNLTSRYYSRGQYGIYAEADGITLLKLGYVGNPVIHIPYSQSFIPSDFTFNPSSYSANGTTYVENVTGGHMGWYGPNTFLNPGRYDITLNLTDSNSVSGDQFQFQVAYPSYFDGPQNVIFIKNITYQDFGSGNTQKVFNFQFDVTGFGYYVQYRAFYLNWNGSLGLNQISISQLSFS